MSSVASLASRLGGAAPAFTAWCGLPDPVVSGHIARAGFDAVTLDMQHGAIDYAAVIRAIPFVAAAGKPAIVRIPVGEFSTASRLLDAGASGVIAPMINTVEDARRLVAFTKFPPVGERSWGPHSALLLSGLSPQDYLQQANGISVVFAMVETREALAIVDEILAVEGLDGIFLGPSDLSIALARGAKVDAAGPETEEALDHAARRAREAGKLVGVYAASGERAGELARRSFDLIAIGSDASMLRLGADAALKAAKG